MHHFEPDSYYSHILPLWLVKLQTAVFREHRSLPPSRGGLSRWIMRAGKQTSKQPSLSQRSHRLFPHTVSPRCSESIYSKIKHIQPHGTAAGSCFNSWLVMLLMSTNAFIKVYTYTVFVTSLPSSTNFNQQSPTSAIQRTESQTGQVILPCLL